MSGLYLVALLAITGLASGQSDVASVSIAPLRSATVLGAPVGTSTAAASYDSASAVSAASAAATSATLAYSSAGIVSTTASAAASTAAAASQVTHGPIQPNNSSLEAREATFPRINARELMKRANLSYPIVTTNKAIPAGYQPAFESLQGSTQANGYLTYMTVATYDIPTCAAKCSSINSCVFFNIYYEKDPDSNSQPVDLLKCAFYSLPQTKATATNVGQYRGAFHVIITGSNGYNKVAAPSAPAGYTLTTLPAAINAPLYDSANQYTYLTYVNLDSYDANACAAACSAQATQAASTSGSTSSCSNRPCVFANMYILSKDGQPQTAVCSLYTAPWNSTYATNTGQYAGSDYYETSNSVGLTNTALTAAG